MTGGSVDNDGIARLDQAGGIVDLANGRNAKRPCDDRDVRGRPAFFQHQTAQSFSVVIKQRRRAHGARHDDGVFRQLLFGRRVILAHQNAHQPVGKIVEVMQTVAQIVVGSTQHSRPGIGLYALNAGLRGEAGCYRFANLVKPALIVRKHSIGFEHVPMFAAIGDIAVFDQPIQIFAQGGNGGIEPFKLVWHIIGDDVGDNHARLVQHDMTESDTLGQRTTDKMHRMSGDRLCTGLGKRR